MPRLHRSASAPTLVALAALAIASTAGAQERTDNTFSWKGTIPAGNQLAISNINGSIRISAASGDQVEVTATKRWRRGNPDDVQVQVVSGKSGGGDVLICAIWYDGDCDEGGSHTHHHEWGRDNDVSVEFEVRIPKGVRSHVNTVNGDLMVEGAGAEVSAHTVNGSVRVGTSTGPVNASTVNGSIDARMSALASDADMEFETVNGRVEVTVPPTINCVLEMSSVNGGLDSDFPLAVSGRINPRHLRATIGKGGPRLRLTTVNGGISLRKGT